MSNYIILSLKHSTKNEAVFWRAENAGYTNIPWAAGIYTEEQVKAKNWYYNNGMNTKAIPLTDEGLHQIGFKCTVDLGKAKGKEASDGRN